MRAEPSYPCDEKPPGGCVGHSSWRNTAQAELSISPSLSLSPAPNNVVALGELGSEILSNFQGCCLQNAVSESDEFCYNGKVLATGLGIAAVSPDTQLNVPWAAFIQQRFQLFILILFYLWPHRTACRILFPHQILSPYPLCPLQWKHRFLTTEQSGKSQISAF